MYKRQVLAQGHVLLDDVPGVGKTTLAMAFARALGLETRRVQFTPDTMPSDILGFSVYDKQAGAFSYQPGAVMTNLLLADEINRKMCIRDRYCCAQMRTLQRLLQCPFFLGVVP